MLASAATRIDCNLAFRLRLGQAQLPASSLAHGPEASGNRTSVSVGAHGTDRCRFVQPDICKHDSLHTGMAKPLSGNLSSFAKKCLSRAISVGFHRNNTFPAVEKKRLSPWLRRCGSKGPFRFNLLIRLTLHKHSRIHAFLMFLHSPGSSLNFFIDLTFLFTVRSYLDISRLQPNAILLTTTQATMRNSEKPGHAPLGAAWLTREQSGKTGRIPGNC